jgi:hypothetical protein
MTVAVVAPSGAPKPASLERSGGGATQDLREIDNTPAAT